MIFFYDKIGIFVTRGLWRLDICHKKVFFKGFFKCWLYHNITWTSSVSLRNPRRIHSSWNSNAGIVLMGGAYNSESTSAELVTNGVSQDYFDLKHDIYG